MTRLDEVLRLKEINERLLDANYNLFIRLIRLARRNGLPIDAETLALTAEVRNLLGLMNVSPRTLKHANKTRDDEIAPRF